MGKSRVRALLVVATGPQNDGQRPLPTKRADYYKRGLPLACLHFSLSTIINGSQELLSSLFLLTALLLLPFDFCEGARDVP